MRTENSECETHALCATALKTLSCSLKSIRTSATSLANRKLASKSVGVHDKASHK